MGYTLQVTIDSVDPHALADWWAATLGWQVERVDEAQVRAAIESGAASIEETAHHDGRLVWAEGAAIVDLDGPPGTPRLVFQAVPEPKTVKDRVHLDVLVARERLGSERDELVARGAAVLSDTTAGAAPDEVARVTLSDPEGNELCLVGHDLAHGRASTSARLAHIATGR
ncbi:MAG: VOC family protein [Cellulomonadaceae bacterium]